MTVSPAAYTGEGMGFHVDIFSGAGKTATRQSASCNIRSDFGPNYWQVGPVPLLRQASKIHDCSQLACRALKRVKRARHTAAPPSC